MQHILDLHIHSRYARGCSKDITISNLTKWAKIKGIDVLGTGDFTHPKWWEELEKELVSEKDGIAHTKDGFAFIYQVEVSLIYTQERGRRVHLVILAPGKKVAAKIRTHLATYGRLDADGRPIFSVPAWKLTRELKKIDNNIEIIPAHAWTPWFSVFGSKSGFDNLQDCFLKETKHIYAIETGISSDIIMNERISDLDKITKVSFSDAHSYWPWRLGREATIVEIPKRSYNNIITAIRTRKGLYATIEVDPSYGKYHWDGHISCNIMQDPKVTAKKGKICSVCKKEMTIGVEYRVNELATRPASKKTLQKEIKLIPLSEIISMVLGCGMNTKKCWTEYWNILSAGKNEFDILMNSSEKDLLLVTKNKEIIKAILEIRKGNIRIDPPGYDGVYGKLKIPGIKINTKVLKE